jgi:hypothetical protein
MDFITALTKATQQDASTQNEYAKDPQSTAQAASATMQESSQSLDDALAKSSRRPFPPSGPNVYGINAGGSNPVPFRFTADKYAQGGASHTTINAITTSGILNTAPEEIYKSVRADPRSFTYTLPYLVANKPYLVRLHFSECWWSGKGARLFDVFIHDQKVLSNFDIWVEAGGSNIACVRDFPTTADSRGQITLQFKTLKDQALVAGLEILEVLEP